MSDWPVIPSPDDGGIGGDHEDGSAIVGRMANLMIPVVLVENGTVCQVQISLPERDARAISNMDHHQAVAMGEFFVLIKESLAEFIRQEG